LYRDEADRLSDLALNSGKEDELIKARKILLTISSHSDIASDSRAVVLYDLARLEMGLGKESEANFFVQTARTIFDPIVEERLKTHPLSTNQRVTI
jgi:hypothetical protein